MTHARAVYRIPPLKTAARVGALAVLGALAGCASSGSIDLEARAQREATRAGAGSFRNVPTPPGLSEGRLTFAEDADARLSAEDVLSQARRESPAAGEPEGDALRWYITGRSALVDGDAQRALDALERAVEADPGSAAAWRDLGEARRAAGDRFGADAAHRRAIEINPNERRSLVRLGLDAAARRDFERAADLLARIDLQAHPGDPAERYLVRAALGQSLIETGRVRAGADLLAQGVDLPDSFGRPTLFPEDLSQLYRFLGDGWTIVGDARVRLDDPLGALAAYERADEFPSFDPVGLLARRLYALLAADRPASAAGELLASVTRNGLTLEDQHIGLISYLRQASPSGARIGEAIERELVESAEALDESERRRISGRLALARAAALPDDEAVLVLRTRLAQAPGDSDAISQLLARSGASTPAALAQEVGALIDASPLNERAYTRTAVRLAGGGEGLYAALPAEPVSSGSALLRARLAAALGHADEAERTLTDVIDADPSFTPAVSALAELLLSQRRLDEAAEVIERLDADAGEPALIAKARGLANLGRAPEAVDLLSRAADSPDATAQIAFQLGSLLERLGDAVGAAQRYGEAVAMDPQLEDAHAARIRLFNQNGPLADRNRLIEAVRELRQAIPSARTLRWLRAQELAAAGQYGAAERALRDLAEEGDDPLVERALVSVWIATSSADTAEAWLRDTLSERPGDPDLVLLLSRALAAQGRHAEAADELEQQLARRPGDVTLSLQLESLLRDHLGRADEADELTLLRLERTPPSVGSGLQEAGVWLRRGRYEEAAHAVTRSIREAAVIRDDELRAALGVAQTLGQRSQEDPSLRPLAIDVLDALSERERVLPEAAHRLRAMLLVLDGADTAALRAATARAFQDVGDDAGQTATAVTQTLVQQGRQDQAAEYLEAVVASRPTHNEALVTLWLGVVAQFPNPDSAERLIDLLVERRVAEQTLQRSVSTSDTQGEENAAAELAHVLAQQYAGASDDESAERMYRVTLRYRPTHVMANNNLGYKLLVEGRDLTEAERMIETAYAGNPNSAAVVDSMGWVRYLRGVFEDETDDSGAVVRQGAIGLLERAVEIGIGEDDPGVFEIHMHLGDALWRAGRTDEAVAQWKAARRAAQNLVQLIQENAPDEVTEAVTGATRRLDAAERSEEPPVAPLDESAREATPEVDAR